MNAQAFDAIRETVTRLKEKYNSDDLITSDEFAFHEKWERLSEVVTRKTGKMLKEDDAIALIDCTGGGSCKNGALIGKFGVYVLNDTYDAEWSGFLTWNDFVSKADFGKGEFFVARICSKPKVGLDISGCDLKMNWVLELFEAIFEMAAGRKPLTRHAVSEKSIRRTMFVRKLGFYFILSIVGCPIVYGGKHIVHSKCIEASLEMQCKKRFCDYRKVVTIDVPWWHPFKNDGYPCFAKISCAAGDRDVSFIAKKVRIVDAAKDDWDVNLGFWGWLGDDYRIMDLKAQ